MGETLCRTPEEFKAWSQNAGHERVMTTFTSYGEVATKRQGEVIAALKDEPETNNGSDIEQIAALVERIRKKV